jgi:hypothetical protein
MGHDSIHQAAESFDCSLLAFRHELLENVERAFNDLRVHCSKRFVRDTLSAEHLNQTWEYQRCSTYRPSVIHPG